MSFPENFFRLPPSYPALEEEPAGRIGPGVKRRFANGEGPTSRLDPRDQVGVFRRKVGRTARLNSSVCAGVVTRFVHEGFWDSRAAAADPRLDIYPGEALERVSVLGVYDSADEVDVDDTAEGIEVEVVSAVAMLKSKSTPVISNIVHRTLHPEPAADAMDEESDDEDGFAEFYDPTFVSCVTRDRNPSISSDGSASTERGFATEVSLEERSHSSSIHSMLSVMALPHIPSRETAPAEEFFPYELFEIAHGEMPSELNELIATAFAFGRVEASTAGKNGSYRVYDEFDRCIAIFKPREGEIGVKPRHAEEAGFVLAKEGIKPGESAFSEYLAFSMQSALGDFNIPTTFYVKTSSVALHPEKTFRVYREGSLQLFVPGAVTFESLPDEARALISQPDLEKVAIYDLAMFNADRNSENLMVLPTADGLKPILVDHGCILPRCARSGGVFCWKDLSHLNAPMSPAAKSMIDSLSTAPLRAILLDLQSKGMPEASLSEFQERILTQEASIALLKIGKEYNLTFAEIAKICTDNLPRVNPLCSIIRSSRSIVESETVVELYRKIDMLVSSYVAKKEELAAIATDDFIDIESSALEQTVLSLGFVSF